LPSIKESSQALYLPRRIYSEKEWMGESLSIEHQFKEKYIVKKVVSRIGFFIRRGIYEC